MHMWIAFTGVVGRLLQSPAHQQIHHSADPAHFDKNLGFALALWDWAFGTLAIPSKTREPIVFGRLGRALRALRRACGRGSQAIAHASLATMTAIHPARRRSN
jgi:sterol desaturase/sphingolipid hydroxylase (fatty acid hydroxylase superfamily)